ncbi:MAG: DUF202 domain-containing protein [Propionibacteriales bacterium]|nr:DUF202 domain-containing protein [Propionibacteriales bacterium]
MTSIAQEDHPWDRGLQVERTKLAWQRTALSATGCSLVIARFVGIHSVAAGVAIAFVAIVGGICVGMGASRRYRRSVRALHHATALPDGRVFAMVTGLLVITGVAAIVLLVGF